MQVDPRRALPSVDALLQQPGMRALESEHGREALLLAIRSLLDEARSALAALPGRTPPDVETLVAMLPERLTKSFAHSLERVINATGVVVHTNLGRAPLPASAAQRVAEVAAAYSNLEYDLASGARGDREEHAESRLTTILGTEAALVVNNNAAAVLLAVNALADGRDVLVSRGELVEIGGSFRIPEILRKGGARLVEVGTTNRTRLADYRAALAPATAMILKVHPSNFRVVGFTESATSAQLAGLAHEAGVPFVEDQGSGYLHACVDVLAGEVTVASALAEGADLVTFSGDKLLGGPQAGLVVGRRALVQRLRTNPLYRALRVDKMTIAALDAVLADHQAGRATQSVEVLRMLAAPRAEIHARAEAVTRFLTAAAAVLAAELIAGVSAVGGGAAPTIELPTTLIALHHPSLSPDALCAQLRAARPPVIARIQNEAVVLDLRTVAPQEESQLVETLVRLAHER